jgi:hypothetical protein
MGRPRATVQPSCERAGNATEAHGRAAPAHLPALSSARAPVKCGGGERPGGGRAGSVRGGACAFGERIKEEEGLCD